MTGQIGGTVAYMPPEQITQFREARPPADHYSVGGNPLHPPDRPDDL